MSRLLSSHPHVRMSLGLKKDSVYLAQDVKVKSKGDIVSCSQLEFVRILPMMIRQFLRCLDFVLGSGMKNINSERLSERPCCVDHLLP